MTKSELMQSFISCGQAIDNCWGFFINVHIAILAGYVLIAEWSKLVTVPYVGILLVAYGLFTLMNYRSLKNSYKMFAALLKDLQAMSIDSTDENVMGFLKKYSVKRQQSITKVIHVVAALLLLVLIFFPPIPFSIF